MLYLIYGTDRPKVIAKAGEVLANLRKRKPDAEVFSMTDDDFDGAKLQTFAGGQGLFENKFVVVLKNLFSKKENLEELVEILPALAASLNVFIFSEGAVPAAVLKVFEKNLAQVQMFAAVPKERPNFFALADALAARDKKRLWVLYLRALRKGASPEEISGILFWKVKELFPSAGRGKFSLEEVQNLAKRLIALYHDAHRGLVDFETGLERFILSV